MTPTPLTNEQLRAEITKIIGSAADYVQGDQLMALFNASLTAREVESQSSQTAKVNRLEVIDDTGGAYVKGSIYGTPVKVELSYQDDNRTLKVFVSALQQSGKDGDVE